ncbi:putative short-chain type dehydrogenase [Leptodontidium sp. MPI-SDFR-AT-0119]|nr:putative short-chain type dehydrogenase [Leptodontidium sp. MPI-SDFR-AT-0119]
MPPPRGTFNLLEGPGDYDVTSAVHSDTYPGISPLSQPATNKSVFIVGASRGIGLAMAISYAKSGASQIAIGARSSLTSQKEAIISAAKKAGRSEPKVLAVKLDVSDQRSTEGAAQLIEKEFGKLDIVINNAGIIGVPAAVGDSAPDIWWETMTVNLKGPYLVTRAFIPLLLKEGDKTIITTSSVGAHLVTPGMSAYQTSKMGVMRLMQFVSEEYKEKGVIAFSIHPGNIMTNMLSDFSGGLPEFLKPVVIDTLELSADTSTFLTREPREWLSGRYINCFWDMLELVAKKDEIVQGDKLKVRLVY